MLAPHTYVGLTKLRPPRYRERQFRRVTIGSMIEIDRIYVHALTLTVQKALAKRNQIHTSFIPFQSFLS